MNYFILAIFIVGVPCAIWAVFSNARKHSREDEVKLWDEDLQEDPEYYGQYGD